MPPFSPAREGLLPNSRNWFWPEKPCQPSVVTHGGSMRPVEPSAAVLLPGPFAIDEAGAVRVGAIHRARDAQVSRQREVFLRVGHELADGRSSAWREAADRTRRAVGRTARVVHHVDAGVLVASGIGFDHVPVEQREDLVEAGVAVQVGVVEVGDSCRRGTGCWSAPASRPGLRSSCETPSPLLIEEGAGVDVLLATGCTAQVVP